MLYALKVLISAIIIVIVTEIAKTNTALGGLIKSLPLISILSFLWLYAETKNVEVIASLSLSTLWFVIPTLPMFWVFAKLLERGLGFYLSLGLSVVVMIICYFIFLKLIKVF